MIWLTLLGTLLGAVIGALATLAAQQISAREARKHEQMRRRDGLRKEYHTLWTHHNRLSLICSDELAFSLREFTDKLASVLLDGTPADTPAWKYLQEPKDRFLRLASSEIKWVGQLSPGDTSDTARPPTLAGRSGLGAQGATEVPGG